MTLALLSSAASAAFAATVLWQYLRRRRPAQLLWAIGLAMFSVAALAGAMARGGGATDTEYRVFYLFGAILNVAWLALGTLALLTRPRIAFAATLLVAIFSAISTFAVFASPVDLSAAVDSGRGFQGSPAPRILAGLGSGIGTLVLVGGALWSGFTFARLHRGGRRAIANVIIAIGVFVIAAGGTATFTGAAGVVEITNLVGVLLMFVGFLLA